MKTYKSKITNKIKDLFAIICADIFIYIVVLAIFDKESTALIVIGIFSIICLYFVLIGDHYKIEVDDKLLKVYKGFRLVKTVNHKDVEYDYSINTIDGDSSCYLYIKDPKQTSYDLSQLGRKNFEYLLEDLGIDLHPIYKVEVKKKGEK